MVLTSWKQLATWLPPTTVPVSSRRLVGANRIAIRYPAGRCCSPEPGITCKLKPGRLRPVQVVTALDTSNGSAILVPIFIQVSYIWDSNPTKEL